MATLKTMLTDLLRRKPGRPSCDSCAFVEFFRSNGDGQSARLQAFCRSPDGPFEDRPIPPERYCNGWRRAKTRPDKPPVGDPTLTV